MSRTTTWWLLAVALHLWPALAMGQSSLARASYRGDLEPGTILVFELATSPDAASIAVEPPDNAPLTEAAIDAIASVPGWLAGDLRAQLRGCDEALQDRIADEVLGCPDDRLVDEVAFVMAHAAREVLSRADLDLVLRNAELIYEVADLVGYAELVERESDEGPYTTLVYRMQSATEETWELPRDEYYWMVVHPTLDVEYLHRVDPRSGNQELDGWFWRDYYLSDDDSPDRSHRRQVALREPEPLTDELLADADWSTAPAHGTFVDLEVGAVELLRAADGRGPVAITFVLGDGRCCDNNFPNPDGQYYATLMPLEQAAAAGTPAPLRNLLDAGTHNRALLDTTLVGAAWGSYDEEGRAVLIVRDRVPFGLEEDPNEAILADLGRPFVVVTSEELSAMTLTTDTAPHVVVDFNKIVIPSDQPRALYEVLAARAADLELFVDYGGVLEIHGATRSEDDWSDLRLPGGIHGSPQTADRYVSEVSISGYPDLLETLEGVTHMWDGVPQPGLSGERHLDPAEGALAVVGWFVSQNMTWRVSEQAYWTRDPSPPRMQQPARLLWQHYGNCGELQDVLGATGRAALLPVWLVSSIADDHVWNEFAALGSMHPYQVSWSDGPTYLDAWTIGADADTGGGKTVSGMVGFRGDGWLVDLLGRYEVEVDEEGLIHGDYTRHSTVEVSVRDADGEPVDGALVVIATPGYYDPRQITPATWGFTDVSGEASLTVGEDNVYYMAVTSDVGHVPEPSDGDPDPADLEDMRFEIFATPTETLDGAVIEREVQLDGHIGAPEAIQAAVPAVEGARGIRLQATVSAERSILLGRSPYQLWHFAEPSSPGQVDVFLVDGAGLAVLEEGMGGGRELFEALASAEDSATVGMELDLPESGPYYLVVSNLGHLSTAQEVSVEVALAALPEPEPIPDAGPGDDGSAMDVRGGGCACSAAAPRRARPLHWLLP